MLPTGNLPFQPNSQESTQKFFNNFFTAQQGIGPETNDAVVAFFQNLTGNKDTGLNLATSIIYTANEQNMDPIEIVNYLKSLQRKNNISVPDTYPGKVNQDAVDTDVYDPDTQTWQSSDKQYAEPGASLPYNQLTEIDAYLAMFLNLNRVGTSLLGISNVPQTSPYIKRAILP